MLLADSARANRLHFMMHFLPATAVTWLLGAWNLGLRPCDPQVPLYLVRKSETSSGLVSELQSGPAFDIRQGQ